MQKANWTRGRYPAPPP